MPWDLVDRLLVFGEPVMDPETGQETIKYPTLRELAEQYGVSRNRMWQYSSKARCVQRREEVRLRTQERYAQQVVERVAGARAKATVDVIAVVDSYIVGFKQALDEGKVRFDSPSDLDRMVGLKELLAGNADARQDLRAGVTLEAIQQRHRRLRGQLAEHTPELTGTTAPEAAGEEDAHGAVH